VIFFIYSCTKAITKFKRVTLRRKEMKGWKHNGDYTKVRRTQSMRG
jgi:hypothetical protein